MVTTEQIILPSKSATNTSSQNPSHSSHTPLTVGQLTKKPPRPAMRCWKISSTVAPDFSGISKHICHFSLRVPLRPLRLCGEKNTYHLPPPAALHTQPPLHPPAINHHCTPTKAPSFTIFVTATTIIVKVSDQFLFPYRHYQATQAQALRNWQRICRHAFRLQKHPVVNNHPSVRPNQSFLRRETRRGIF